MVLLSRRFSASCIRSDSQLIGGFLAALLIFMRNTQDTEGRDCSWEEDGIHRLKDIGMSCSRWFIESLDDYTVAVLVPNDSPLIQQSKYEVIYNISENIISSFVLFTTFGLTGSLDELKDFTSDFGNSVDNIVFEALTSSLNIELKFEAGGEVEIYDANLY
ncbi:MAG: hypothetical protein INQ03_02130 [Candidatus Heimdallarchaeota archaeon]|nr:hypothetical protein [Candidatus Heimdallarchaeota archaeon]